LARFAEFDRNSLHQLQPTHILDHPCGSGLEHRLRFTGGAGDDGETGAAGVLGSEGFDGVLAGFKFDLFRAA
jgi:hypothetical protein